MEGWKDRGKKGLSGWRDDETEGWMDEGIKGWIDGGMER